MPDWEALAKKHGGIAAVPVDYDAIAQKHGGVVNGQPVKTTPTDTIGPDTRGPVEHWFDDFQHDIKTGSGFTAPGRFLHKVGLQPTGTGEQKNAGDLFGGALIGPAEVGEGVSALTNGGNAKKTVQNVNKVARGIGHTLAPVAAVTAPELIAPMAATYGPVQAGIEKTADAVGADPDTAELIGNAAMLGEPLAKRLAGPVGRFAVRHAPDIGTTVGLGAAAAEIGQGHASPQSVIIGMLGAHPAGKLATKAVEAAGRTASGLSSTPLLPHEVGLNPGGYSQEAIPDVTPDQLANHVGIKLPAPAEPKLLESGPITMPPPAESPEPLIRTPQSQVVRGKGGRMTKQFLTGQSETDDKPRMGTQAPILPGLGDSQTPPPLNASTAAQPTTEFKNNGIIPPPNSNLPTNSVPVSSAPQTRPLITIQDSEVVPSNPATGQQSVTLPETKSGPQLVSSPTMEAGLQAYKEGQRQGPTLSDTEIRANFGKVNGPQPVNGAPRRINGADASKGSGDLIDFPEPAPLTKESESPIINTGQDMPKSSDMSRRDFLKGAAKTAGAASMPKGLGNALHSMGEDELHPDLKSLAQSFLDNDLADDRREYGPEDFESAYQLGPAEAKKLYDFVQKGFPGLVPNFDNMDPEVRAERDAMDAEDAEIPEPENVASSTPPVAGEDDILPGDFSLNTPARLYHGSGENLINTGIHARDTTDLFDAETGDPNSDGSTKHKGVYLTLDPSHADDYAQHGADNGPDIPGRHQQGTVHTVDLPRGSSMRVDPYDRQFGGDPHPTSLVDVKSLGIQKPGMYSDDSVLHRGDIPSGAVNTQHDLIDTHGIQQDMRENLDRGQQNAEDLRMKAAYKGSKPGYNPDLPGEDGNTDLMPWARTPWEPKDKVLPGDFSLNQPQTFYHGSDAENLDNTGIKSGVSQGTRDGISDGEFSGKPEDYKGVFLSDNPSDTDIFGKNNYSVDLPRKSSMRLDPMEGAPEGNSLIHMGDVPPEAVNRGQQNADTDKVLPGDFSLNQPTRFYHGSNAENLANTGIQARESEGMNDLFHDFPEALPPGAEPSDYKGVYLHPNPDEAGLYGAVHGVDLPRGSRMRKDPGGDSADEQELIHRGDIPPDLISMPKTPGVPKTADVDPPLPKGMIKTWDGVGAAKEPDTKLYHGTDSANLPNIREKGLIPSPFNYLTSDATHAYDYGGIKNGDSSVLAVEKSHPALINLEADPSYEGTPKSGQSFRTTSSIPPHDLLDEEGNLIKLPSVGDNTPIERRADTSRRKMIEDMSPEEMKKELLTSDKTGLPNRRAFEEAQTKGGAATVGMSDADGLKALNDKFGYEAGDQLLKAKAEALKEAGLDSYHDKGDEFLHRGDSPEDLQAKLDKARDIFRNRVIEVQMKDGTTRQFKGADFSFGTGGNLEQAEAGLKDHKADRETRGERARGELRGITEVGPDSSQGDKGAPEMNRAENFKKLVPGGSLDEKASRDIQEWGEPQFDNTDIANTSFLRALQKWGKEPNAQTELGKYINGKEASIDPKVKSHLDKLSSDIKSELKSFWNAYGDKSLYALMQNIKGGMGHVVYNDLLYKSEQDSLDQFYRDAKYSPEEKQKVDKFLKDKE